MSSNFQALAAALKIPNQDSDGAHTSSITIPATSPYTYILGQGAPLDYPSGWQLVPPTGITGVVTVSGGGYSSWTEVTLGTSLSGGQFSVDYSTSPTGGTVYFSSTDAGKSVSVTFTGALLVNEAFFSSLIAAIQAIGLAPGQASGLVGIDSNYHVSIPAGGKLLVPDSGSLSGTSVAAGADPAGNVAIPQGYANGTVITVNTTACTTSSRVLITQYSGSTNPGWRCFRQYVNTGSFTVVIDTNEGGGGNTLQAGGFDWFVFN